MGLQLRLIAAVAAALVWPGELTCIGGALFVANVGLGGPVLALATGSTSVVSYSLFRILLPPLLGCPESHIASLILAALLSQSPVSLAARLGAPPAALLLLNALLALLPPRRRHAFFFAGGFAAAVAACVWWGGGPQTMGTWVWRTAHQAGRDAIFMMAVTAIGVPLAVRWAPGDFQGRKTFHALLLVAVLGTSQAR